MKSKFKDNFLNERGYIRSYGVISIDLNILYGIYCEANNLKFNSLDFL